MAGKAKSGGKSASRKQTVSKSDNLPGFFSDYGGSGVQLLPGQLSAAEVKKMTDRYKTGGSGGKKK